jgi:hypothetical protein
MNRNRLGPLMLAVLFAGSSAAWASDKFRGDGGDNWIEHVRQSPSATQPDVNRTALLFGSPAPVSLAARTLTVKPGMKYINVESGETVAFSAGTGTQAWTFIEAMQSTSVDLGVLLPDVPDAKGVRVIIARSKWLTGS